MDAKDLDDLTEIATAWLPQNGETPVNESVMAVLALKAVARVRELEAQTVITIRAAMPDGKAYGTVGEVRELWDRMTAAKTENARLRGMADPQTTSDRLLRAAALAEQACQLVAETHRSHDAQANADLRDASSELHWTARKIRVAEQRIDASKRSSG